MDGKASREDGKYTNYMAGHGVDDDSWSIIILLFNVKDTQSNFMFMTIVMLMHSFVQ